MPEPTAFERTNYLRTVGTLTLTSGLAPDAETGGDAFNSLHALLD